MKIRTPSLSTPMGDAWVHPVRNGADLEAFLDWLADRSPARNTPLALDTEATGLDLFAPTWALRLIQVGDATDAWVFEWEGPGRTLARRGLAEVWARPVPLALHNATFDLLALDVAGVCPMERLWPRVLDTRHLAHLVDPRGRQEGGTGHGLKDLARHYLSSAAPDSEAALVEEGRKHKLKKADLYAGLPLRNEALVRYAGVDVVLTYRLGKLLHPKVRENGTERLVTFEREVAAVCAGMTKRGIRYDRAYAEDLGDHLRAAAARAEETLLWTYELKNVNSPAQVVTLLEGMGAVLTERTPAGQPKVDKAVLEALMGSEDARLAEVARLITLAKGSTKLASTYVDGVLSTLDAQGRVHASIHTLQARTARMSITEPPLQTLPAGDWRIRRAFLAEPGWVIGSTDYSQVELCVLAALANEPRMMAAIAEGQDLHDATARLMYGEDFTKAQRKLAKNTGFGRVYGGGATTLARQAGVDMDTARSAMASYDRAYPGIARYSKALQEKAEAMGFKARTPSGRILPLDRSRVYAVTNYMVQSTARDVLADALLRLKAAGLENFLLLPIHDEVLWQAPAAEAEEVGRAVAEAMTVPDFYGVRLRAETEVGSWSWGHLYGYQEGSSDA